MWHNRIKAAGDSHQGREQLLREGGALLSTQSAAESLRTYLQDWGREMWAEYTDIVSNCKVYILHHEPAL